MPVSHCYGHLVYKKPSISIYTIEEEGCAIACCLFFLSCFPYRVCCRISPFPPLFCRGSGAMPAWCRLYAHRTAWAEVNESPREFKVTPRQGNTASGNLRRAAKRRERDSYNTPCATAGDRSYPCVPPPMISSCLVLHSRLT